MKYQRKPRIVDAVQMPQKGTITFSDGVQTEVAEGDYLLLNADGSFSGSVGQAYFNESYEPVPEPEPVPDEAPRRGRRH